MTGAAQHTAISDASPVPGLRHRPSWQPVAPPWLAALHQALPWRMCSVHPLSPSPSPPLPGAHGRVDPPATIDWSFCHPGPAGAPACITGTSASHGCTDAWLPAPLWLHPSSSLLQPRTTPVAYLYRTKYVPSGSSCVTGPRWTTWSASRASPLAACPECLMTCSNLEARSTPQPRPTYEAVQENLCSMSRGVQGPLEKMERQSKPSPTAPWSTP